MRRSWQSMGTFLRGALTTSRRRFPSSRPSNLAVVASAATTFSTTATATATATSTATSICGRRRNGSGGPSKGKGKGNGNGGGGTTRSRSSFLWPVASSSSSSDPMISLFLSPSSFFSSTAIGDSNSDSNSGNNSGNNSSDDGKNARQARDETDSKSRPWTGLSSASALASASSAPLEEFIQHSTYPNRALKVLESSSSCNYNHSHRNGDDDDDGGGGGDEETSILPLETQRHLLELVTTSGNPQLLKRASKLNWHHDAHCRHLVIQGLSRLPHGNGAGEAAHLLWEWMQQLTLQEEGPSPSPSSSSSSSSSEPPSLNTIRSVLTACATAGQYDWARKIFERQQQQQLNNSSSKATIPSLDRDCYHRVLQACCKEGALEEALKIFHLMNKHDVEASTFSSLTTTTPTLSTYKILLQTHVNHYFSKTTSKPPQNSHHTPRREGQGNRKKHGTTTTTTTALSGGQQTYDFFKAIPVEMPPDTLCYNLTLNALAQDGDSELAQSLFLEWLEIIQSQQMDGEEEEQVDGRASIVAMESSSNNSNGNEDIHKTKKLAADPIPFRTLLKAFATVQTVQATERAEQLLQDLESLTWVGIDARSYTTVLAMWCKLGFPERARRLLDDLLTRHLEDVDASAQFQAETMQFEASPHTKRRLAQEQQHIVSRWQPDPMSFRTVIGALSKVEPMTREVAVQAQNTLDDMVTGMGYPANLVTCNTVLKCWTQASDPDTAHTILQQEMSHRWNVPPDIVSHNTVLTGHAKLGNVAECVSIVTQLVEDALIAMDEEEVSPSTPYEHRQSSSLTGTIPTPNARTAAAVITALSKEGTDEAAQAAETWWLQLHDWHTTLGWPDCAPNRITYNALLQCWARAGNTERVKYLLKEFQHSMPPKERPDIITYNTWLSSLLNSHAKRNHLDDNTDDDSGNSIIKKAESILEELVAMGLQPTPQTVRTVQRLLERDPSMEGNNSKRQTKWEDLQARFFYYVAAQNGGNHRNRHNGQRRDGRTRKQKKNDGGGQRRQPSNLDQTSTPDPNGASVSSKLHRQ